MSLKATMTKPNKESISYVINKRIGIDNGQYGIWEIKNNDMLFVPKGSAVYITEILNQIDNGQKQLNLYFFDSHGSKIEVLFPRKELTEQGIMELLGLGVQVTKQDAKILITSILNQEPEAPCKLLHETLGFWKYDNKTVFLGKIGIGVDSNFNGKLQVGKKGKYNNWIAMIKQEVLGHTPLEFILAVGGSGVLVDYLRDDINVENIIVHLIGESSSGKSTAGLLMVSCGAKPSFQGDGLVMNFSDTFNAILAGLKSSYPALLDEGSLCRYNPTGFLYSLAMGKEKKRLTKELNTTEFAHFNTAIAITSEKSLLNLSDENSGLLVRNIELQGVEWTKNAQSADRIKNVIQQNYGFLIPKLAKRILELEDEEGKEYLINWFWKWQERLIKEAKQSNQYNPLTERVSKQFAVILLSAELVEEVLKIEMDIEKLVKFLQIHSLVKDPNNADIGQRALEYLLQYISKYYSQFITPDNMDIVPRDCKGKITTGKKVVLNNREISKKKLLIADVVFEQILREGNFQDKKVILKRWKAEGYLKAEKDRYLSDISILKEFPVKGYIINLPVKESLHKDNPCSLRSRKHSKLIGCTDNDENKFDWEEEE